ncbi:erythrocyte band 7 integral membrane protein homolog [Aeropyrum pernix K1]|uniref:Erythrocyte band 7 integral membrane protein homolog n=1 Tax=Aeropyrum pernix (strain ATCC 700893 / DSM 11879 / JCM 9820 / NBRC 100138 / K1) TaxID=272557 RepID=Q9Y9Y6_AERPE|nr:slipin family protein [Aeropyrum pernix]BAA81164.2 erythrocyte band 7 integral membrane protein homolog [Aeropyrum pernix K1]
MIIPGVNVLLGQALIPVGVALLIVLILLSMSIKIVREYERAVIFRLGRLIGVKGPGLFLIIPFVDTLVKVDLRIVTVDIPEQRTITKDNVTVGVDAVVYYKVFDPEKAVVRIENYHYAVVMLAQTTLRDVIGQVELDDLLTKREEINKKLQEILDQLTDPWGIKVTAVTIKEVKLPESMLRAMAKQAEAERWRRARIIEAEGERQAAKIMAEAAEFYEKHPAALRLRELQTLIEVAKEKNLVVVTPLRMGAEDMIGLMAQGMQGRVLERRE